MLIPYSKEAKITFLWSLKKIVSAQSQMCYITATWTTTTTKKKSNMGKYGLQCSKYNDTKIIDKTCMTNDTRITLTNNNLIAPL